MNVRECDGAARFIGRHCRARRASLRRVTIEGEREFFERHYVRSLRYAIKKFPSLSRAEHEDIVQHAWETILRRLRKAGDGSRPTVQETYGEGWVLTFVNWAGLNWLRSARRRGAVQQRLTAPEEVLHPRHPRLDLCLEELPDRQLDILLRTEVHGETQTEIARRLGLHLNTVNTLRTQALTALRTCLETSEP